ncbi:MAG: hypothetical protein NUV80_03620 [Candidatus Berkelbacteria bacterium]|nr:hypothetical protein [Candidatus Berkelbacteria bacterium]MCR4307625.1 hypothetical protein [Candidatus Berkelbacteria bacterium]
MLDKDSVVKTTVNNKNNHHDLTLKITQHELAQLGVASEADLTVTGHCCDCPAGNMNFMVVDATSFGGVEAGRSKRAFEYGGDDFPFDEAIDDLIKEARFMLDQFKTLLR